MKENSKHRLIFWAALFALLTGTVLHWQFRYQETGITFSRGGLPESWAGEPAVKGLALPDWKEDQSLHFLPTKDLRVGTRKTWEARGQESVKVRLTHRAPSGMQEPTAKKYPIEVLVAPYDRDGQMLARHLSLVAFSDPGKKWKVTEAVAVLPPETDRFSVSFVANAGVGDYEISALDIVGVKTTDWFSFVAVMLAILWSGWILWAVRKQREERGWVRISSIFATVWIIGWGIFLVFPRTIDIPRPFFSTFSSFPKPGSALIPESLPPKAPQLQNQNSPRKAAPEPVNWSRQILAWFKDHRGGRFLMHLGVMGLFSGVLLLLMKPGQAYPFIIAMAVGIELVPWIWLGNFDRDDASDLVAYGVAIALAVPIAGKLRR